MNKLNRFYHLLKSREMHPVPSVDSMTTLCVLSEIVEIGLVKF